MKATRSKTFETAPKIEIMITGKYANFTSILEGVLSSAIYIVGKLSCQLRSYQLVPTSIQANDILFQAGKHPRVSDVFKHIDSAGIMN